VLQNDAVHFLNGFKIYFLSFRHNTITTIIKMAKSAWHRHVAAFRAAHKGMDPKKVFGEAAKTFKKQSGGAAMGGELQPESFVANPEFPSTGTGVQMTARLYSGGSKRRGSKCRGSKRRGSKRGSKRRTRKGGTGYHCVGSACLMEEQ